METLELLQQLEDLIDNSKQLGGKAFFVNTDVFFKLTDQLRDSLPEDVKAADRITRDSDQIIDDAKEQAARIISKAKDDAAESVTAAQTKADRLVDESEIKRLAVFQSKEIIASAEEEAKSVKSGADAYAKEVLNNLENFVTALSKTIQRGRDTLEQKAGADNKYE